MKVKIYAAYGSNLNLKQMKRRCLQATVMSQGELKGYKLTFRGKNSGFANVELSDQGKVPVVLWKITKDCELALDRYEGYPGLYRKKTVTIATAAGQQEAMLYVMTTQYEGMPALPNEYYFAGIKQGYEDHHMNIKPLTDAFKATLAELTGKE